MAHPAVFAIMVGVAIGTAIYYYLNSESPPAHQYHRGGNNQTDQDYYKYKSNNARSYPSIPRRRSRRNSTDQCVICFEAITLYTIRKLDSCGHEFHTGCISKWLKEKKDCPICRTTV